MTEYILTYWSHASETSYDVGPFASIEEADAWADERGIDDHDLAALNPPHTDSDDMISLWS